MEFNSLDYEEVKISINQCPNWVFIDLVHECTGKWGITWSLDLENFVRDLSDYIFGEINHGEEFYVSIKGSKYLIGDEVLEDASLVFFVEGYQEEAEDGEEELNPFYDSWTKYELIDEEKKIDNDGC